MLASFNRLWDHPVPPLLVLLFANAAFYVWVISALAQHWGLNCVPFDTGTQINPPRIRCDAGKLRARPAQPVAAGHVLWRGLSRSASGADKGKGYCPF
jgi:hypothetical protein